MEAAFHRHDGQPRQLAADEPAAVADRRALGKMRNVPIFQRGLFLNVLDEAAQAGAQDDAGVRRARPGFANELRWA